MTEGAICIPMTTMVGAVPDSVNEIVNPYAVLTAVARTLCGFYTVHTIIQSPALESR